MGALYLPFGQQFAKKTRIPGHAVVEIYGLIGGPKPWHIHCRGPTELAYAAGQVFPISSRARIAMNEDYCLIGFGRTKLQER